MKLASVEEIIIIVHLVIHKNIKNTAVLDITERVSNFRLCILALTSSDSLQEIKVFVGGAMLYLAYLSPIMQLAIKV